jgi:hypothetical protein
MNSTLLLAAWSTATTALEKYDYRNRQPYTDSRRRKDKQTRSQYRRGRKVAA